MKMKEQNQKTSIGEIVRSRDLKRLTYRLRMRAITCSEIRVVTEKKAFGYRRTR
jgi:hypothetical protein